MVAEPQLHVANQSRWIPAVIVGEADNATAGGAKASVPGGGDAPRFHADVIDIEDAANRFDNRKEAGVLVLVNDNYLHRRMFLRREGIQQMLHFAGSSFGCANQADDRHTQSRA